MASWGVGRKSKQSWMLCYIISLVLLFLSVFCCLGWLNFFWTSSTSVGEVWFQTDPNLVWTETKLAVSVSVWKYWLTNRTAWFRFGQPAITLKQFHSWFAPCNTFIIIIYDFFIFRMSLLFLAVWLSVLTHTPMQYINKHKHKLRLATCRLRNLPARWPPHPLISSGIMM